MAAPWDKTASQILAEERANRKSLAGYNARPKATWEQGSLTSHERREQEQRRAEASKYSYSTPWTLRENNVMEDFDKQVAALDYNLTAPWGDATRCGPTYGGPRPYTAEISKANYKYETLWEPVPLSKERQEQIAAYEYCPPYRVEFNGIPDKHQHHRRVIPGHNNKTVAPWAHGHEPAPPVTRNIFPKPETVLWDKPPAADNSVPLESSGDPILDSLRAQLKSRGASGICGLAKKFKIMDDDESGTLDYDEFTKAMKECEIADLSKKAIAHLFRYFDRDDSGTISYDEFLVGIRGVLNTRRRELVHLAFASMDKDNSGSIDLEDIRRVYNAKASPQVVARIKTEEEVLAEFLENFEVGGTKDGIVSLEEFENYYSNLSASIDSDDYFELMMRNAWHISGGSGWCGNTTNTRVLVTHEDGRQTVEEIQNDLGVGRKDKVGMVAKLRAQGIAANAININGSAGMDREVPNFANKPPAPSRANQNRLPQTQASRPGSALRPQPQAQQFAQPTTQPISQQFVQPPVQQQQQAQVQGISDVQNQFSSYRPASARATGRLRTVSLSATLNQAPMAPTAPLSSTAPLPSRGVRR